MNLKFKRLCTIGIHSWEIRQECLMVTTGREDVVIAWKQCKYCGKSKLIHILQ